MKSATHTKSEVVSPSTFTSARVLSASSSKSGLDPVLTEECPWEVVAASEFVDMPGPFAAQARKFSWRERKTPKREDESQTARKQREGADRFVNDSRDTQGRQRVGPQKRVTWDLLVRGHEERQRIACIRRREQGKKALYRRRRLRRLQPVAGPGQNLPQSPAFSTAARPSQHGL